jgi:hypothetical protein
MESLLSPEYSAAASVLRFGLDIKLIRFLSSVAKKKKKNKKPTKWTCLIKRAKTPPGHNHPLCVFCHPSSRFPTSSDNKVKSRNEEGKKICGPF